MGLSKIQSFILVSILVICCILSSLFIFNENATDSVHDVITHNVNEELCEQSILEKNSSRNSRSQTFDQTLDYLSIETVTTQTDVYYNETFDENQYFFIDEGRTLSFHSCVVPIDVKLTFNGTGELIIENSSFFHVEAYHDLEATILDSTLTYSEIKGNTIALFQKSTLQQLFVSGNATVLISDCEINKMHEGSPIPRSGHSGTMVKAADYSRIIFAPYTDTSYWGAPPAGIILKTVGVSYNETDSLFYMKGTVYLHFYVEGFNPTFNPKPISMRIYVDGVLDTTAECGREESCWGISHRFNASYYPKGYHILRAEINNSVAVNWVELEVFIDNYSPSIILQSPANNTVQISDTVITLAITDMNLSSTWYNWDGGANQSFTVQWEVTLSLVDGWHWLNVHANDTSSLTTSMAYRFYVDSMFPVITLNTPANGSTVQSSAFFDLSIADPNLDTVLYCWDGGNPLEWHYPWHIKFPSTGDYHSLTVFANDTVGHLTVQHFIWWVNSAPVIALLSPADILQCTLNTVIVFNITDSSLESVYYRWDQEESNELVSPFEIAVSGSGYHILTVTARDSHGSITEFNGSFFVLAAASVETSQFPPTTAYSGEEFTYAFTITNTETVSLDLLLLISGTGDTVLQGNNSHVLLAPGEAREFVVVIQPDHASIHQLLFSLYHGDQLYHQFDLQFKVDPGWLSPTFLGPIFTALVLIAAIIVITVVTAVVMLSRKKRKYLKQQKVQNALNALRSGIQVQLSKIAGLTGIEEAEIERILESLCIDKTTGEYMPAEQVFIRASPEDTSLEKAFEE